MITKAVAWAKTSKNLRVNPIHGEEEIYMILSETFEAKEKNEEETTREGNLEVEVGDLFCPSYLNTSTFTCPSNSFTDLIQGIYIKN